MKTETVTLRVSDGTEMRAFAAWPQETPRAGVLVIQEIFGVTAHIRDIAERCAAEGYLALAPEVFHRSAPAGWQSGYDDYGPGMAQAQKITPEGMKADLHTSHAWLREHVGKGKIGIMGFCLGGRTAYRGNAELPFDAAVSFYGGGISQMPELAAQQHGPILFFWGGKDAHIKGEHIESVARAMREAKKPFVNVEMSGADHAFMRQGHKSYHAESAREAWALVQAFFGVHLAGEK